MTEYDFGADVAEHDLNLERYFLRNPAFSAVVTDESDLVLGAKGTGKSAIALYLANPDTAIAELGDCLLIPAFNLRGSTLFRRLIDSSHEDLDESAFRDVFLAYIGGLAANTLLATFADADERAPLEEALNRVGLNVLPADATAKNVWRTVLSRFRPRLEAGVDPMGSPTLAIIPDVAAPQLPGEEYDVSYDALEELLDRVYAFLENVDQRCWILFDRLDEAFSDSPDLEIPALRGLLRAQLDAGSLGARLRVKSFLRLDVFDRITKDRGFVNATHLRTMRIVWRSESIFELIALRLSQGLESDLPYADLTDVANAKRLCQALLPAYMDGVRSLVWLLLVTVDATREYNPRNLLTLLRRARLEQLEIERRGSKGKQAVGHDLSHRALSAGFNHLSSSRLEDTVFAESPIARSYVERLRGRRTAFTREALADALDLASEDLDAAIHTLRYVGFLRLAEGEYVIPALFRPAMFVSVHGVESKLGTVPASSDQATHEESKRVDLAGTTMTLRNERQAQPLTEIVSPDLEEKRTRKRNRNRQTRTGRDEFVPSGQRSEISNELDHQERLYEELGDVEEQEVQQTSLSKDIGERNFQAVARAARRRAEEGDFLAGLQLLEPHINDGRARRLTARLAFASGDSAVMLTTAESVAQSMEWAADDQGALAALFFGLEEIPTAIEKIRKVNPSEATRFERALISTIGFDSVRELDFWSATVRAIDLAPSGSARSVVQADWSLIAASRAMAMWRYFWVNPSGNVMSIRAIIERIWPTVPLQQALVGRALRYLKRYSVDGSSTPPYFYAYQTASVVITMETLGALPTDLRDRVIVTAAKDLSALTEQHQLKFAEWVPYNEFFADVVSRAGTRLPFTKPNDRLGVEDALSIGREVARVISLLGTGSPKRLLLSRVGDFLVRPPGALDYRALGYRSFLDLTTAVADRTHLFRVHQEIGGHPYVVAA
ncbi:hypothetical protein ABC304_09950 [Microbacterium sp. 1P10UB]|uniref:P-loop ATPase, Sll1717 family n=1 Tax=unclassified Microbacterium TaxID=2609290 RepID=UPI0039A211BC